MIRTKPPPEGRPTPLVLVPPKEGKPFGRNAPRILAFRARQLKAFELRLAGLTFAKIAQRLGYANEAGPQKAIDTWLKNLATPLIDEYRKLEGERLDVAQASVWEGVEKGDLKCIDRFVRISERRAKLFGLDAPVQHVVDGGLNLQGSQTVMGEQPTRPVRVYLPDNGREDGRPLWEHRRPGNGSDDGGHVGGNGSGQDS
jgi:hypothetical protein